MIELGFDALLNILVVEIELADAVVGAELGVVVGYDGFEGGFFAFGVLLVKEVRVLPLPVVCQM